MQLTPKTTKTKMTKIKQNYTKTLLKLLQKAIEERRRSDLNKRPLTRLTTSNKCRIKS